MSVKLIDLGASKKRNENVQRRILQRQNGTQRHFVFPKPETPLLSDKSEFPSLSESIARTSTFSPPGGSLKYSDKLKLSSLARSQVTVPTNVQNKCNAGIANTDQCSDKITRLEILSVDNKNKLSDKSMQNIPKQVSSGSLNKSMSSSNKNSHLLKKESAKQKPVLKSKLNVQNLPIKAPILNTTNSDVLATSGNQSNKCVAVESSELKGECSATQDSSKAKKKKKRKSKVKRQVAMQSGKITFLTPEVHSKILNQASTVNSQNSLKSSIIGNINDEEEYPELGKAVLPINQKENLKKNISPECHVEVADKSVGPSVEKSVISENIFMGSPNASEKIVEKKEKNDKVHSHYPITVSFYEMLLEKNVKKKEVNELKSEIETPDFIELSKLKHKKSSNHPHNLLDASAPAVKRGKEREKPKPKKPSQLKKIILLDRKARREHLLQMQNTFEEENTTNENGLMLEPHEEKSDQLTAKREDQSEDNFEDDPSSFWSENEENLETDLQSTENTDICVEDELISEMVDLNLAQESDSYRIISDLSSNFNEVVEKDDFVKKSISPLNESSGAEKNSSVASQIDNQLVVKAEMHVNISQSPDSLINNLTGNIKQDFSVKEKAAKILLHTRNFREYCNHLISKDIDDVTYALLDDLVRFQDRLHQKDPVKARMKKRMIYGVKEVKKHIKLRKLKCIIMAVDIENVETQGGLNDVLNEIKLLAIDHHIPFVFALSRKAIGKVCHKPVPVSCVGIFNYEGSEANFKKIFELQSQSKVDYTEIFNKLLIKITDEEAAALIKAKKEAPETLCDIRANILSKFFLSCDSTKSEDETFDSKSNEDMPDLTT